MTSDKPTQVTADGEDYLKWCARAKAGELHIPNVVVLRPGTYRLTLMWPDASPAVQKDLFSC